MEKSFQIQSEGIKEADILVGIPSYNNVRSIGHVVKSRDLPVLPNIFQGQRQY